VPITFQRSDPPTAGAPPAEVLEAAWAAAGRWEELEDEDRWVSFDVCAGRLRVELRTLDGRPLRGLSPSEALELAAGEPVG